MLVDYSNIVSLDGFSSSTLSNYAYLINPSYNPTWAVAAEDIPYTITYNIGTLDIISNLQTLNILICVLLFIQLIIMFFVSYYVIMTRFRFGRG